MKLLINKILSLFGLTNPAKGVKVSAEIKAKTILSHKPEGAKVFIETGTREGDMLEAMLPHFDKLYTVELEHGAYNAAALRFKENENIKLYEGDSGEKISDILAEVDEQAVIWLDAHGNTVELTGDNKAPVLAELKAIFAHHIKNHVILIDDGRHLSDSDYKILKKIATEHGQTLKVKNGLYILQS